MRNLIIIAGPTAVGKSAMAVKLAKRINGSIISADSMQVYKGMDIGSAKVTKEEMDGIPHYLIDVLNPSQEFSVSVFQKMAKDALEDIYSKNRVPIVCGGTGFYIQALLYDIDFTKEDSGQEYRHYLEEKVQNEGIDIVYKELEAVDPKSCENIHKNNIKRVIRALEFYHNTGKRISEHNEEERMKESPYNFCYFALNDKRDLVYDRIDRRVDKMVEEGLVEEVKRLKENGCTIDMVSMQGLGYKEILAYLDGDISLEEALYIIKRDTRHFAKRQLTWFNREKEVVFINRSDFENDEERMLDFMLSELKNKKII